MRNPFARKPSSAIGTRLNGPARVSLLGREQVGKTTLLRGIASRDGKPTDIRYELPMAGLFLEILQREPLTIMSQTVGQAKPDAFTKDLETVRENADGVIYMVDCRDREFFINALEDLETFVLAQRDLNGAPLLVLANRYDAEGAMSLQEVDQGVRTPDRQYYRGLKDDQRPFALKCVNADTGEGVQEALNWLVDAINERAADSAS